MNAGAGDNTLKVNNATASATDTWTVKGLNSGTVSTPIRSPSELDRIAAPRDQSRGYFFCFTISSIDD